MHILVANPKPFYGQDLTRALGTGLEIIEAVLTDPKTVEETRCRNPDVMLLEIDLPFPDDSRAVNQIMDEQPGIKLTMLTASEDIELLFTALRTVAAASLQESLGTKEIACSLLDRENPFSPSLEECVLCEFRKVPDRSENILNERQREVLHLVAQGLDYVKVGKRLFISERTVKYHMAKIKQILHLSSQGQVVAWAWEHGIGYREQN